MADAPPEFRYLNPLASPVLTNKKSEFENPRSLISQAALVFGTLEKRPIVSADVAVFDPQNPIRPEQFFDNGSIAHRCALVLNHKEASLLANQEDLFQASKFLQASLIRGKKSHYEVIVIKMAHAGCWVCTRDEITPVPAYRTDRVFSIGSGDIFSAAFYAKWALDNWSPIESASFASKATAMYCNAGVVSSSIASVAEHDELEALPLVTPSAPARKKQIYLASPFFTQGEFALMEHLRELLSTPWTKVFSPFHEVGFGGPNEIYSPDISGLEQSDLVFAVLAGLDPGTIFEIGYAVNVGKPVFCLAEAVAEKDMTMILGGGAKVETDIVSAVYKTLWSTLD